MKKIVSTFALALLVGGLTFAQDASVKVGAWGRALFVPVLTGNQNAETDPATESVLGVSWGGAPRVGISVTGTSEFVGFQLDINGDGGAISAGDQQKIWVKPFAGLTVQVGQAYDDTLRGNSAFGSWDWIRFGPIQGEDNVFTRVDTQQGFEVSYSVDALYVFAAARGFNGEYGGFPAGTRDLNDEVLNNLQYGAGYTIKDVGLIRAQVIGRPLGDDSYNVVEAAFRLTAVQNLYADVGIKYPTDSELYGYSFDLEAYANYTVDAAKIHLLVSYAPSSDTDLQPDMMGVGAGLDYSLGDGLGFGADLRYYSIEDGFGDPTDPASSLITFFAGITKGFSNGLIGIGIQYSTANADPYGGTPVDENPAQIALPIRAEYWF